MTAKRKYEVVYTTITTRKLIIKASSQTEAYALADDMIGHSPLTGALVESTTNIQFPKPLKEEVTDEA